MCGVDVGCEALHVLHLVHGQFHHAQLEWVIGGNVFCIGERTCVELCQRQCVIHKAQLHGLATIDEAALIQQFLGLARMNVPGHGEVLEIGGEEHGVFGGEDDVHRGGNHPAGENAVAAHDGNGGLLQVAPAQGEVHERFPRMCITAAQTCCQGPALPLGQLVRAAEVVARGEVRAGSVEHDDVHPVILHRLVEGGIQCIEQRPTLGIAIVGAVQRNACDMAL